MRNDRDEVKTALKDRIEDLCRRLLPDGRREGRFWVAHNPVTGDAGTHPKDPTLKVPLDRDVGAWIDWRSGDKGDVIRLVEHCLATDFKGAMDFAREFLGLRSMSRAERADFSRRNDARRAAAEQIAREKALDRRHAVQRLWDGARPIAEEGAAAAVARRYLGEGRGIPLDHVPALDPITFRVLPALEWWRGARWETKGGTRRKAAPGPSFPAIVSGFRAATGQVTAVHCTFLDPAAPVKAPVEASKLMFGDSLGSVIAISLGPEAVVHEDAAEPHPLILCEGVEDGLSLAIGAPEARVWAAGSLLHMGAAPVWLACISAVFVAADNDWKSRTAQGQLDQVLDRLQQHGKPVEVMRSAVGKDFNDGMTE